MWCIPILIAAILFYIFVMMKRNALDPHFYMWQERNKTTDRWARYVDGMSYINSDTKMALEMIRKDENGKRFYVWTAEAWDYWDPPDLVFEIGKVDCDGFAALTADGLARFAKYPDVWWMEYYGYYRKYTYNPDTGEYEYVVVRGGHAITAYKKNGELLAFSNTHWWHDKNFEDFVDVGEETFPEGIYWVICRHWETGKMQWQLKAKEGEILGGSNIFDRNLAELKDIKHLDKWSVV